MNDELALQRMIRAAEEAERYEADLLQTAARIKKYREVHGAPPESDAALDEWAQENLKQPLDPYEVLSRAEIVQVWEDAEDPRRGSF